MLHLNVLVERVVLIAKFLDSSPDSNNLVNNTHLQKGLSYMFCFLIHSLDDVSPYVAQKATLSIGTIHDSAMKV